MSFSQQKGCWRRRAVMVALVAGVFVFGRQVSASEQAAPGAGQQPAVPALGTAQAEGPVIKVTADEAVRMALEKNLNISAARLDPQIQDFAVAQAQSVWAPSLFASFDRRSSNAPPRSFLVGAAPTITDSRFFTNAGVQQQLRWGGASYQVSFDGARSTTTGFTAFNPTLSSNVSAQYDQPLLRNFKIDQFRQNFLLSQNQRQVADIQLQQQISNTSRAVRYAYYNLVGALAGLEVSQKSLDLARESLKNNRTRVEVGTMAPIDIIEAEAEVASNEEAVILAENNIRSAEDALRVLILDPAQADYWTARLEPAEQPTLAPVAIDIDAAVANALRNRTDLLNLKKQLEANDINIRYFENQRLPDLNLQATYGLTGLGGTQFQFDPLDERFPPEPIGTTNRPFGDVLRDVFGNDYRAWSIGFQVGYPLGKSNAEAGLARNRLEKTQGQTSLRALELQVATAVRDAGRQVTTNLKRVEATRKAREFAEKRLEAEQKRFTVGLSQTFQLFQAQRDLARQRQNELIAIIDYNRSLIDFETVQVAPIGGLGGR